MEEIFKIVKNLYGKCVTLMGKLGDIQGPMTKSEFPHIFPKH